MMIINEKTGTIKHLLLNSWLLPRLALAFMATTLSATAAMAAEEHTFHSAWAKYEGQRDWIGKE